MPSSLLIFLERYDVTFFLLLSFVFVVLRVIRIVMPKYVYFVRHGETVLNRSRIRQGQEGGLSEEGKDQAIKTGIRLSQMHIQHMYVSPYERTQETAALINTHASIPFSYTPLLAERKNPSEIIGKSYDNPEVQKIINMIDFTNHDPDFRFSDEENFSDLRVRAKGLLLFLALRPYTRIVCVTHGIFLKMVLAHITYGKKLNPLHHAALAYATQVHNAGITLLYYNPWRVFVGKPLWSIVVFDDISKI